MFQDFKTEIKLFLIVAGVAVIIAVGGISLRYQEDLSLIVEVDTSGWQTYRNERYNYGIKYPAEWVLEIDGRGVWEVQNPELGEVVGLLKNTKVSPESFELLNQANIFITATENLNNLSLKEWYYLPEILCPPSDIPISLPAERPASCYPFFKQDADDLREIKKQIEEIEGYPERVEEIMIDNIKALKETHDHWATIILSKSPYVFSFSLSIEEYVEGSAFPIEQEFDQILSAFRFLEE